MKNPDPQPTHTLWLGYAAAAWAVIFAAISFYWAAGGTALLETLGVTLRDMALARDPLAILVGGWLVGLAKLIGALLPLSLVRGWCRLLSCRLLRALTWAAGIGMLLYGAASFVQHLLMATGVITLPPGLGRTGAYGHLLLWDPWWSLGGILFIAVSYQLSAVSRRLKADG